MLEKKKNELYEQGYRFVGNHSAIKVCSYCKDSIRGKDHCYKQDFYGIESHRCVQMTPALQHCNLRCKWCWRDIVHTSPKWQGPIDEPKYIIDECIKQQKKYLQGFKGFTLQTKQKTLEAEHPTQFAISLAGEPTYYPRLPELIAEIKSRGHTAFLVTNGTHPSMIKKLAQHKKYNPTNLYITLPAPDVKTFTESCRPLFNAKYTWKKIRESLQLLAIFPGRTTIRLTVARNVNLQNAEKYAQLIKLAKPDGIEVKAYMWVGFSQKRLTLQHMPYHDEIVAFAKELQSYLPKYVITKQKERSRVVLLEKRTK